MDDTMKYSEMPNSSDLIYIDMMKSDGYTQEEIKAIMTRMLSHPMFKTKSIRLSENYKSAFYAGALSAIRDCDDAFSTIVMSSSEGKVND